MTAWFVERMMKMKKLSILLVAIFTLAAFIGPSAYAGNKTVAQQPSQKTTATSKAANGKLPKGITPRTDVPDATKPVIEVDHESARLMVRYKASDKNAYSVTIQGKGQKEAEWYDLYAVNADEYFPLSQGNGTYEVMVIRIVSGKGQIVAKGTVQLNAKDKNAAFLSSNYYVKWESADQSQKYVDNLTKKVSKGSSLESTIFNSVVKMMNYDYDALNNLPDGYVPDMDTTLKTKKGVCYDISVLLAGMLRYSDVPTRLVMGYSTATKGAYHAWNEILIDGKWVVVDATADAIYDKAGHDTTMKKSNKDYEKIHEY